MHDASKRGLHEKCGYYKRIKDSGTKQEMQRCVEKMKKKTAYF